ncbi:carbohydrate-binding protein [Actinoplanes sp. NPDC049596]|uniref:carbohydrate-binding protein n=1 Tax=unclassified Actinoplanes TaxID=2626549 RepID=UPI0034205F2E
MVTGILALYGLGPFHKTTTPVTPTARPTPSSAARPADLTFEAESYTSHQGTRNTSHTKARGGTAVGPTEAVGWAGYRHHPLDGVRAIRLRYSAGEGDAGVQVRAGSASGRLLGTVNLPRTASANTFGQVTAKLASSGSGALYIVFTGSRSIDIDTVTLMS